MNKDILLEKIIYLNKDSKKLFDKSMKQIAKKYDLTKSEVFILSIIKHTPETLKSCTIVKNHNFSKAYVSQVTNSLKEKGYISLVTDPDDKRYQKIKLLNKADNVLNEITKVFEVNLNIIKKGITKEELNNFIGIIDKIIKNLKDYEEENND